MGLILLAAPGIDRFHLHEQLGRRLLQEDHRLLVLSPDPAKHIFYRAQGMPSRPLLPNWRCNHPRIPLEEFALQDCRLAGLRRPNLAQLRQASRRLEGLVDPILRFFEVELPDLVFLHQGRSGVHRLLHFIGREFGSQVMHTGAGLLPGTMQWNDEGIDGDSSSCRRTAMDYRAQVADEMFLSAALAALLGGAKAPPLSRRRVYSPDLWDRLSLATARLCRGRVAAAGRALSSWRQALLDRGQEDNRPFDLPVPPFFVLLLQDAHCPRLSLDANEPPDQATLLRATVAAAGKIDADARVLVLPPASGLEPEAKIAMGELDARAELLQPCHANASIAIASAAITINHPLGMMAILAGTPLVHLARSPYQVTGVAQHGLLDDLAADIERSLNLDNPTLRQRFLTRQLAYDHVWCDPAQPDTNGMRGLLQDIDKRLSQIQVQSKKQVAYRAGPVWPLASTTPPAC